MSIKSRYRRYSAASCSMLGPASSPVHRRSNAELCPTFRGGAPRGDRRFQDGDRVARGTGDVRSAHRRGPDPEREWGRPPDHFRIGKVAAGDVVPPYRVFLRAFPQDRLELDCRTDFRLPGDRDGSVVGVLRGARATAETAGRSSSGPSMVSDRSDPPSGGTSSPSPVLRGRGILAGHRVGDGLVFPR